MNGGSSGDFDRGDAADDDAAIDPFDPSRSQFRAQLRLVIETKVQARAHNRRVGDVLATTDLELAAELRALGFDSERARVLDLLPLIWVAWSDGKIQRNERARILEILRVRGIAPGSSCWDLIETLLETRPSDAYLEAALDALSRLIGNRAATKATVVAMCVEVARASGGIFGIVSSVDPRERRRLEAVAEALGPEAKAELQSALLGRS